MKAMDILETIGAIRDTYIQEAGTVPEQAAPEKKRKKISNFPRRAAAVIAVLLAGLLFFRTPMGAAAAELVRDQVTKLIETLFPPRDLVVMPEGTPEVITHEAQGRDPEAEQPGFALYVDTASYEMTQDNGVSYIRPKPVQYDREDIRSQQAALLEGLSPEEQEQAIDQRIRELQEFYQTLPSCEIEIREEPETDVQASIAQSRQTLLSQEYTLSETRWTDRPASFRFTASQGTNWDSQQQIHYFVDNGTGGCFHLISRYYLEAAEGHGVRFATMLQTFTVVTGQDLQTASGESSSLAESMEQNLEAAKQQDQALLLQWQNALTQLDMNDAARARYNLWLDTLELFWPVVEANQTGANRDALLVQQLDWSVEKKNAQDAAVAEVDGGSLSDSVFYSLGAEQLQARMEALLSILRGTASLPRDTGETNPSPEETVAAFLKAYFQGDSQGILPWLSEDFTAVAEVYDGGGSPVVHAVKGLDHVVRDMAQWGRLTPSVEICPEDSSDAYVYLSMELHWEAGSWKIVSYGLEG